MLSSTHPCGRVRGGPNAERAGLQRGHGRGLLELLGVLHHPQGVAGALHADGSVGDGIYGAEGRSGWKDLKCSVLDDGLLNFRERVRVLTQLR